MEYPIRIALIAAAASLWLRDAVAEPANAVSPQAASGEPAIMKLYNDEIHIIAPTEIKTVFDLEGAAETHKSLPGRPGEIVRAIPGMESARQKLGPRGPILFGRNT
jgi:hypothetical protein